MERPAIFFDRDNTLNVSDGYLGDPAGVVLVDGAADAVARARQMGFAVIVFSNQSGVARGLFGEDDVRAVNVRLEELLFQANPQALIDRHEFCPFHPQATLEQYRLDSDRRKPGAGMIHSAAEAMGLDLPRSWVIGDAGRDIDAGHAAGCRTILFRDPKLAPSPAAETSPARPAEFTVATLAEAMDTVQREMARPPQEIQPQDAAQSAPAAAVHASDAQPAPAAAAVPPDPEPKGSAPVSVPPPQVEHISEEQIHAPEQPPTPETAMPATETPGVHPTPQPAPVAAAHPVSAQPAPGRAAPPAPPAAPPISTARLEALCEQILQELRRRHEQAPADFSITKLLAGILQVIVLAVLFGAYMRSGDSNAFQSVMLVAIALQTLTIALLIMGRQR